MDARHELAELFRAGSHLFPNLRHVLVSWPAGEQRPDDERSRLGSRLQPREAMGGGADEDGTMQWVATATGSWAKHPECQHIPGRQYEHFFKRDFGELRHGDNRPIEKWEDEHAACQRFRVIARRAVELVPQTHEYESVHPSQRWVLFVHDTLFPDAHCGDRLRYSVLEDAFLDSARVISRVPVSEGADKKGNAQNKRPCYDRDHTFLRWKNDEKMTPAIIRDRWNEQHPREHVGKSEAGRDVVKKGINAALRDLASETWET